MKIKTKQQIKANARDVTWCDQLIKCSQAEKGIVAALSEGPHGLHKHSWMRHSADTGSGILLESHFSGSTDFPV